MPREPGESDPRPYVFTALEVGGILLGTTRLSVVNRTGIVAAPCGEDRTAMEDKDVT
jgi:hypothetical protein